MGRIKVNTEELISKSKILETSSDVFSREGSEILRFIGTLPSYDGQLSKPSHETALEVNKQCQEMKIGLKDNSDSLAKIAKAFEEVDNTTQNILNNNIALLSDSPLLRNNLLLDQEGDDNLGYEDYEDYIIVKRNGQRYKIYKNSQNQEIIDRYMNDIDQYYSDKAIFDALIKDLQSQSGSAYLAGLTIYILISLGVVSIVLWPQVMFYLLAAGVSSELIGRMIENATEIAAEIGHLAEEEVSEAIAKIIDPLNPGPIIENINKLKEINSAMNDDLARIEQDIKDLHLPELSPKPSPSPSETPTPSPSETSTPEPSETPTPTPSENPTPTP
jgi:uncharacterized protein YukE